MTTADAQRFTTRPRSRAGRPWLGGAWVVLVVAVLAAVWSPAPATGGPSVATGQPGCQEPFLPVHVSRTLYSARFGTPQVWPEHPVTAPSYDVYGQQPPVRIDTDGDGVPDGVRLGDDDDGPVARWEVAADGATITVDDGESERVFTTPPGVRGIPADASVTAVRADDGRLYLALISLTFVVASPSEFRALWDLEDPCRVLPRSEPEPAVCETPQPPSFIAVPRSEGTSTQLWPPTPGPVERPADWRGDLPVLDLLDRDVDGVTDFYAVPPMWADRGRTTVAVERTAVGFRLTAEGDGRLRILATPDEVALPAGRTARLSARWIDGRAHLVLALIADPLTDGPASHEVVWDLEALCGSAAPQAEAAAPAPPARPVTGRAGYTG